MLPASGLAPSQTPGGAGFLVNFFRAKFGRGRVRRRRGGQLGLSGAFKGQCPLPTISSCLAFSHENKARYPHNGGVGALRSKSGKSGLSKALLYVGTLEAHAPARVARSLPQKDPEDSDLIPDFGITQARCRGRQRALRPPARAGGGIFIWLFVAPGVQGHLCQGARCTKLQNRDFGVYA